MNAIMLALLLSGNASAHCGVCGTGAESGPQGAGGVPRHQDRKAPRGEHAHIVKDEGSKLYEVPEGAEPAHAEPPRGELAAPSAAPAAANPTPGSAMETARGGEEDAGKAPAGSMSPEDARDNMRTVLDSRLAKTGGLWRVKDVKSGKPRGLALQELGKAKDEGAGRWSARATFRDKAGTVRARALVDLSGERWHVVSLEPEPAAKKGR